MRLLSKSRCRLGVYPMAPQCIEVIPEVQYENDDSEEGIGEEEEEAQYDVLKPKRKKRTPWVKRLFRLKRKRQRPSYDGKETATKRGWWRRSSPSSETFQNTFSSSSMVSSGSSDELDRKSLSHTHCFDYDQNPSADNDCLPAMSGNYLLGGGGGRFHPASPGRIRRKNSRTAALLTTTEEPSYLQLRRWLFPVAEDDDASATTLITMSSAADLRRGGSRTNIRRPTLERFPSWPQTALSSPPTSAQTPTGAPPPTLSRHAAVQGFRYALYQSVRFDLLLLALQLVTDWLSRVCVLAWFLVLPPNVVFPVYRRTYNYLADVTEACCEYFGLEALLLLWAPISALQLWIRATDVVTSGQPLQPNSLLSTRGRRRDKRTIIEKENESMTIPEEETMQTANVMMV